MDRPSLRDVFRYAFGGKVVGHDRWVLDDVQGGRFRVRFAVAGALPVVLAGAAVSTVVGSSAGGVLVRLALSFLVVALCAQRAAPAFLQGGTEARRRVLHRHGLRGPGGAGAGARAVSPGRRTGTAKARIVAACATAAAVVAFLADSGGALDQVLRLDRAVRGHHGAAAQRNAAYRQLSSLRPDEPRPALIAALGEPAATGLSKSGLVQDIWVVEVDAAPAALVLSRSDRSGIVELLAVSTLRRDFTPSLPDYWWGKNVTPLVLGRSSLADVASGSDVLYGAQPADDAGWLFAAGSASHSRGFRYQAWGSQDFFCSSQYPFPQLTVPLQILLDRAGRSALPDEVPGRFPAHRLGPADLAAAQRNIQRIYQAPITAVAVTSPLASLRTTGLPVVFSPLMRGLFRDCT